MTYTQLRRNEQRLIDEMVALQKEVAAMRLRVKHLIRETV